MRVFNGVLTLPLTANFVLWIRRPQFTFSDDEEDEKRVVRSLKDKRLACFEGCG